MTDINFSPTFKHVAWVDNRDRVAASGQNGFNVRFDSIQKDLENLSTVVRQIDTGLKAAGQRPTVERKLTLAPAFVPVEGDPPWILDAFGVAVRKDGSLPNVRGIMSVAMPDGVVLRRLRVTGRNTGSGTLQVSLFRSPLADTGNLETVVQVSCSGGPFGDPQDVPADRNRVDMGTYRYFIDANVDNAPAGTSLGITSIQLSYLST
ncbi:hypothetical protein AQF52_0289 [Streptomyces venezuelae]|uniref:hypothetical protein n=1 Tax=Streptomyces gardneri TaxID=66892 RepID=UPI0006BCA7F4|nr:hypothetical protein [Streptomyces gardneri]ALO05889.1 hypothetical protein AQF52_0289 [Streptomyces venezuelae]QPK43414.1 hypothetical protein H4W23_01375 [Streptomyces gardneri]WRK34640.1 hypothetical protein U0M97_01380 [Streptomyces venezuelae]CUM43894.1 hypothetical protein BN2537_16753 [Streptomyces venezuelae]